MIVEIETVCRSAFSLETVKSPDISANFDAQKFLRTVITFQGIEDCFGDREFIQQVRKDANYQLSKKITEFMGGKLVN